MERSLREEARFVNPEVTRVLEQVFGKIDQLHLRGSGSAIFTIGPNQPLHTFKRARVFSSDTSIEEALLHPERTLGPQRWLTSSRAAVGGLSAMDSGT
jgi:hypothetical protein